MAIGDIFRLSMEGIGPNAQEVVNVFHFRQATSTGSDTGEELCVAFEEDIVPLYATLISDDCLITKLEARNVTQPLFGFDYPISPQVPGDLSGETLPSMVAAVVSWRTGLIGRSRRGRSYVWPTTEAQQNLTQWIPTYITLLETWAIAMSNITDSGSGATYIHCVWSTVLATDFTVTSAIVDPIAGTQRRRRPGRGS